MDAKGWPPPKITVLILSAKIKHLAKGAIHAFSRLLRHVLSAAWWFSPKQPHPKRYARFPLLQYDLKVLFYFVNDICGYSWNHIMEMFARRRFGRSKVYVVHSRSLALKPFVSKYGESSCRISRAFWSFTPEKRVLLDNFLGFTVPQF